MPQTKTPIPIAKINRSASKWIILSVLILVVAPASAESILFRIGTGGSAGTYLPIGSLIAESISGTSGHHQDTAYNEPDLLAIAQRSTGSVSNVVDISDGLLEAGLAQADVVHWAYHGTGPFEDESPRKNLRGLATLYLESVHLIVREGTDINSIQDIVGHRVSLDERGSGTRLDVLAILNAYRLKTDTFEPVYLKTSDAFERLRKDELDAVFLVAGYPVNAVSELVAEGEARIVPITGLPATSISSDFPYFSVDTIPPDTYMNANAIPTLGVPAQLIINASVAEDLVYNITSMLWNENSLSLLKQGHPKGNDVQLESALTGMDVPLHPGAARFYHENGLLDDL